MALEEIRESMERRFGIREQAAYATVELDNAAFIELTLDSCKVSRDQQVYEIAANHGSKNPTQQHVIVTDRGGSGEIVLAGPVNLNDIDILAYAHFQKVVEDASTPYTKSFEHYETHPDFTANEGKFLTFIRRMPEASTSYKVGGCVCSNFKLSAARDELVIYEATLRGVGPGVDTSNPSGTWTPSDDADFLYFNDIEAATLDFSAGLASPVNVLIRSFEIESNYEIEKVGHDPITGFEMLAFMNRGGSFKVDLLRDSTATDILAAITNNMMCRFTLDLGEMTIDVTGKVEDAEQSEDGLLAESITCRMLSVTNGAVDPMFVLAVMNETNRGW
jgi:hypothetical protein